MSHRPKIIRPQSLEGKTVALTTLEATTISRAAAVAKRLLDEVKPVLDSLDVIYNTETTGGGDTITQANLDLATNLSGLTKAQLDDALFALTSAVRGALDNAYVQLAHLAARA